MKNILKPWSAPLGLGLMLTPFCHGQASLTGPPHNVIYSNGSDANGNDAFPEIANSNYTDVIVNFLTVDTNCNLHDQPYVSPDDMQTLHNAGKTVLVSFGNSQSAAYQACYGQMKNQGDSLANQIAYFVTSNGFDGVDIDFEDNSGFDGTGGYDGVDFLTQLTDDLYSQLPKYQNIITHAPQTPYWLQNYNYQYPPYAQIFWNTGSEIAWFNDQTYDQCYGGVTDCNASQKIANYENIVSSWGVPPIRLLVGEFVSTCPTAGCAGNGSLPWISAAGDGNDMNTVITQLEQRYFDGFGGVMGWNFTLDSNQPDQNGNTWNAEMAGSLYYSVQPHWVGLDAQTGLYLDSSDNGNGWGSVYTDSWNGGNSQNWRFFLNTIINIQTGQCLDSDIYGNVYTDNCNTGNYQNWQFFGLTIRNRQTGRCLDSNIYGNAYTQSCNTGNYQNWYDANY